MKNPVIIIGTGSLAQLALETLQRNDILVYGFLAEKELPQTNEINHIPILGNIEKEGNYLQTIGKNYAIFVAIEQTTSRQQYIKQLSSQDPNIFINLVHPSAQLATSAKLGLGNLIDAGATISPDISLGNHCHIYKQVAIEYGAKIQNFVHIGSGSIIGEQATIEENVFIGPGSTIIAGIHIGKGARIGAGSVVLESVKEKEVVLGNPAQPVKLN
jgi:sugar O-acyltransferase (sialic acid O-acetyltransferase NeuD family)